MITSPIFAQVPPFPRTGQAHAILHSLVNPPTVFLYGGLFEGTAQGEVYTITFNTNRAPPHLCIDIFKTRGRGPSPRSLRLLAARNCKLIVWGGDVSPSTSHNDLQSLHILSTTSHSWTQHECSGPSPTGVVSRSATVFKTSFMSSLAAPPTAHYTATSGGSI
ncbi:hypothetical protein PCANC_19316 [Puccinia coronata f. sp. avenae]|uniref:Uncharacterized protein n=1 Tax=Puccinia coronata f. sp. avenae TaxID=200324 RepID=A0A2N5V4P7_9BASI|nr:hypothetical protein PCANC_19316 [Puccinia coronata f. sp. avenae]PLW44979.1 hypothetical protein PCASD_06911 [Puccinia coronata f. sp. avenae]